ncbi:MAG: hypothetical protein U1D30_17780 [Planctomycetota bacterium]
MSNCFLATFQAEITCPIGHPLMGGGVAPAARIEDPLFAQGVVILGAGEPIVMVSVDWCEIRNDAYDRWKSSIAVAAHTTPERVLLSCIHQHDTPIADLMAQQILEENHCVGSICDLKFHETTLQRVSRAVRSGLATPRRITQLGTGQSKVNQVASNRRVVDDAGKILSFGRTSATNDERLRNGPEGTIDPWLKTLSFWDGDIPVVALHFYATHPMSYYGKGGVSSDFIGLARKRRSADDPAIPQIYFSGCSGNVTAGKYNDGNPDNRAVLADRIYHAMKDAWRDTTKHLFDLPRFHEVAMRLEPRDDPGFTVPDLTHRLKNDARPFGQCLAALGLSWRKRADQGHTIAVPAIDFGPADFLLLPGESYVEFQLAAQQELPNQFVTVAGYGECATGYIPTEKAFEEGDTNLGDWCWVARGSEARMREAIHQALTRRNP